MFFFQLKLIYINMFIKRIFPTKNVGSTQKKIVAKLLIKG